MCGIAGFIHAARDASAREEVVRAMIARQRHRGPDDDGLVSREEATLGMCRLAIFDPAHGHQPMVTADGRYHLVFNGAIYNHRELRHRLESEGCEFRTHCDTEVLLAAYVRWGRACLGRLRGMFAFAIWDAQSHTLFAARDPFGLKPFYYARGPGGGFLFASELNALLATGLVSDDIDPAAVGDYLAWMSVPAPRTIYRAALSLSPGEWIQVDAEANFVVAKWWSLPRAGPAVPARSYREFTQELRLRLEDTIRAHRLADVPVGAFLSGGMDSSTVVGLMGGGAPRLKTFSLIFNEAQYSERDAARLLAQKFGTEHHEELLTGPRLAADLETIVGSMDQPTGDGVNTYCISRAARAGGVKVVLSGLGGDELFGGYPSFRDLPKLARVIPLWHLAPAKVRSAVIRRLNRGDVRGRKLADFLEYGRGLQELSSLRRRILSETTRRSFLAPEARHLAEQQGPHHPRLPEIVAESFGADSFQIVSAWELRAYMADVLLRDSDVFSMAHSLELRVPLVDRPLLEWWWHQPKEFKFDPRRPKGAMIDAMADLIPREISARPKMGFTLPFARWMKHDLRPYLEDVFSAGSLARCPWLDAPAVTRQWRDYVASNDTRAWGRVWTLAMLVAFVNRRQIKRERFPAGSPDL